MRSKILLYHCFILCFSDNILTCLFSMYRSFSVTSFIQIFRLFLKYHFPFFRTVLGSEQYSMESTVSTYPFPQYILRPDHNQHPQSGHYICYNYELTVSHHYHKFKLGLTLGVHSMAFDKCIIAYIL